MNHCVRTVVSTCAKEKHTHVVGGLGRKQLESILYFVDLSQTNLQQESSGCAAAEHRSVWVTARVSEAPTRPGIGSFRSFPTPLSCGDKLQVLDWEMSLLYFVNL